MFCLEFVKLKFVIVKIDLIVFDWFFKKWCFIFLIIFKVCFVVVLVGRFIWLNKIFWFLFGKNVDGNCEKINIMLFMIKL